MCMQVCVFLCIFVGVCVFICHRSSVAILTKEPATIKSICLNQFSIGSFAIAVALDIA